MDALNALYKDQLFTHEQDGKLTTYNTSAMMRDIMAGKVKPAGVTIALLEHVYTHVRDNHGIESTRVDQLTEEDLKIPILIALFPEDESHLIIDGSHRLVWAWEHGIREMKAFLFQPEQYTPYIVTGFAVARTLEEAMSVVKLS